MMTANMKTGRTQDWLNLILAALLFFSPRFMGYTGDVMPARNAWIVGVVLALIAIAAISTFAEWEEWLNLALGLWLVASPWMLGFTTHLHALWSHIAVGLLIAGISAWAVWDYRHEPHATA